MGKKIGIIAFVISIVLFTIGVVVQLNTIKYFEVPSDYYQIAMEDQELYQQKLNELTEEYKAKIPTVYRVLDKVTDVLLLVDIVLIIVSFVMINKEKSKGKVFPTLAIVIIILTFIVNIIISFSAIDMEALFTAAENSMSSNNKVEEAEAIEEDAEEGYNDIAIEDGEVGYNDIAIEDQNETNEILSPTSDYVIIDEDVANVDE